MLMYTKPAVLKCSPFGLKWGVELGRINKAKTFGEQQYLNLAK